MVMCRPEMLIKWATPVARKTSQSPRSMAFWSPTIRAASRPAVWRSATRSNTESRTAWRARSTGWRQLSARRCGSGSRSPART